MAGGKETPRQKMIGLMYLVLMALLAMNVSKEIINAFVTLNNNMESQNIDAIAANGSIIQLLNGKANSPELGPKEKEQAKVWYDRALEVRSFARRTANFYMKEADEMLVAGDGSRSWIEEGQDGFFSIVDLLAEESDYSRKDDYDIPTFLFVGDNHKTINAKGTALLTTLENYRDSLCIMIGDKPNDKADQPRYSFTPPTIVKQNNSDTSWLAVLDEALKTVKPSDHKAIIDIYRVLTVPREVKNHNTMYPWQAAQFDHAPIAAAAAVFTSLKGRVIQAERVALNNFSEQSEAPPFKFNKIDPLAFAPASYINSGDSVKVSVMIAAYDSMAKPEIRYWFDDTLRKGEAKYSTRNQVAFGGSVGDHYVVGDIAVETKAGKEWKPWSFKYSVGAPNAAVSAYELNVLYSGWDNKIKVAAGGFPPERVTVNCNGCASFTKQGEFYIAKVKGIKGEATISVSARADDGSTVSLASEKFRIFPLPKPEPRFGGQGGDKPNMSIALAKNAKVIQAYMDGPLNVNYEITKFSMRVSKAGKTATISSTGKNLSAEMSGAIQAMTKGSTLTFMDIRAKGPSGVEIPIGSLSFVLE